MTLEGRLEDVEPVSEEGKGPQKHPGLEKRIADADPTKPGTEPAKPKAKSVRDELRGQLRR